MNQQRKPPLDDAERRDRLRLIRSENVGPITFGVCSTVRTAAAAYMHCRISPGEAAAAAHPYLFGRRGGLRDRRVCLDRRRLVVLGDPEYPPQLAAIEDAPATFAVIGDVALLSQPAIAVVGSRNASLNGRRLARSLARDLGLGGFVVVSGLARGIDAEAHRARSRPARSAVLAGGVDVCYPRENAELYTRIAEQGGARLRSAARHGAAGPSLSQAKPDHLRALAGRAGRRANLRSGSLITARMAAEQGREVFAVPGSPLDPRARGCNDLIRQGATLTETAADVLAVLGSPFAQPQAAARTIAVGAAATVPRRGGTDEARRAVAETLSPAPVAVDEIIRTCQLSPALVSTILLEWELAGRLERHPGNRVSSDRLDSGGEPMDVVIVESPARRRRSTSIWATATVLASYGHVRDLPAKDGSVRPDADFAMDWEVDAKAGKHIKAIAEAVRGAGRSTSPPTPTARARRSPGTSARFCGRRRRCRASTSSASSSTRSPAAPSWMPSPGRAISTASWSRLIWRAARSTTWSALRSRRCCGASSPAAARPAACSRWRCA